ncbi:MAG: hypothetical protein AAGC85_24405, partial [Bacteroidota bacterium]
MGQRHESYSLRLSGNSPYFLLKIRQKVSSEKSCVHLRPANANPNVKLNPADPHERFTRATKEAASTLCDVLYRSAEEKILLEDYVNVRPDQTEICFGSPTSNLIARAVMGYRQPKDREAIRGSMEYDANLQELFEFPYLYELNHKRISKYAVKRSMPYQCEREHNENKPKIFNWGISTGSGEDDVLLPKIDERGILVEDYLLITCVPNCLDETAFDQHKIFLIGGTHSEGTKAFNKVMQNEKLLDYMLKVSDRYRAWQILVKMSNVNTDGMGDIEKVEYD